MSSPQSKRSKKMNNMTELDTIHEHPEYEMLSSISFYCADCGMDLDDMLSGPSIIPNEKQHFTSPLDLSDEHLAEVKLDCLFLAVELFKKQELTALTDLIAIASDLETYVTTKDLGQ